MYVINAISYYVENNKCIYYIVSLKSKLSCQKTDKRWVENWSWTKLINVEFQETVQDRCINTQEVIFWCKV